MKKSFSKKNSSLSRWKKSKPLKIPGTSLSQVVLKERGEVEIKMELKGKATLS